ncbi:hypothetical protein WMF11_24995 [Sorangium sp. So ce295]|uniref:hypothetical protein n=1 Tax=Sorangium sp. So ce295 TaxID=3133295 RepID=UPI003F5DC030
MSLALGIFLLVLAVVLGGLLAVLRGWDSGIMPAMRTFAVVAAASIALLHLLPEALGELGWRALLPAAAGLLAPMVMEHLVVGEDCVDHAPRMARALGYAAVLVHQFGDGAAVASLARAGLLSTPVVLALAAHTVPLAMVVCLLTRDTRAGADGLRVACAALTGIALATVLGALTPRLIGEQRFESAEPWVLATIAGLLVHAVSHEAIASRAETPASRAGEAAGGLLGLALGVLGVDEEAWVRRLPSGFGVAGLVLLAALVLLRSYGPRRAAQPRL